jgi:hypothetical protein
MQTQLALEPERMLEQAAHHVRARARRVPLERVQDAIGDTLADVVPAAVRQLVGEVLRPQPEHARTRRRERIVHRRERHRDQRRIARGLAAQVVRVRRIDLRAAAAQQLEPDQRLGRAVRVAHGLREREAQHRAEAVARAHRRCRRRPVLRRQQPAERVERMTRRHHRARRVRLAAHAHAVRAPRPYQDLVHRRIRHHAAAVRLDVTAQRLRQHARAAARPRDATLMVERLPQQERRTHRLERRRPRLRRHPDQRRDQLLLGERARRQVAVRQHDLAQRALPVAAHRAAEAEAAPQLERAGHVEERVAHHRRERMPAHAEVAVRLALRRELRLDLVRGAVEIAPYRETRAILERRVEQRVQIDVVETVLMQLQLFRDGRQPDQDVRTAAQVEAVARHDLLRRHRAAHAALLLEHAHALTRLRQVRGRDEAVVTRADDDRVEVAHRRRNSSAPCTTSRLVTRKNTASSSGSPTRCSPVV